MGSSSSKEKKSSSKTRGSNLTVSTQDTIDNDVSSDNPKERKDKKKLLKKQKKGKTKCKNGHDKKHSHGDCSKVHKSISFQEKTVCGVGGSSQVYRKKSACPSCDARDMILDQLRGRSGSDKSLRFSDFNKVMRQSRIYQRDTNPAEIPLDEILDPVPETICFICGVYTGSVTRTCRVCLHVYHHGCLQKIGHAMDAHALRLAQLEIWSCHQCSDISRLLTREETHHTSACLEDLDVDHDTVTEANYIHYKEEMSRALGKDVTPEQRSAWIDGFRSVAGAGDSTALDWTQFLQVETVAILHNRCKDSMVRLLTDSEFALARSLYKGMNNPEAVTMAAVKDSITGLYAQFNHRWFQEDNMFMDTADMSRCVSWSEFLRLLAIHMVTVRNNPLHVTNADRSGALTPSFESADDDDYRTCESDSDLLSAVNEGVGKINLSDVQTLNESPDDNKMMSFLEYFTETINLGRGSSSDAAPEISDEDKATEKTEEVSGEAPAATSQKLPLWQNRSFFRQHPNNTTVTDEPETRPAATEKIVNRRSEILVRPSTEEGRSPRRALSQKLVAPAYGLVDKIQNSDWNKDTF